MATLKEPELDEILAFCAEDPVERVFLEDIARRGLGRFMALAPNGRLTALCHAGANLVPSGVGCDAFAEVVDDWRARMIIGEQGAVSELWEAAQPRLPSPRPSTPDLNPLRLQPKRRISHTSITPTQAASSPAARNTCGATSTVRAAIRFIASGNSA